MEIIMERKKASGIFILAVIAVAMCFAAIGMMRDTVSEYAEIYDKTLRLHIPANSNSDVDQSVKLQVRDAVVELLKEPLSECKSRDEAIAAVQEIKSEIEAEANKTLRKNGADYTASVSVTEEYYPRREYEGIALPAGTYASVKIELGKADGKNWWCVLFPQVCTGTASNVGETLADVGFTANQIKLLTKYEDTGYTVKFKILEVISYFFPKK